MNVTNHASVEQNHDLSREDYLSLAKFLVVLPASLLAGTIALIHGSDLAGVENLLAGDGRQALRHTVRGFTVSQTGGLMVLLVTLWRFEVSRILRNVPDLWVAYVQKCLVTVTVLALGLQLYGAVGAFVLAHVSGV